jgi:hypothetical protein
MDTKTMQTPETKLKNKVKEILRELAREYNLYWDMSGASLYGTAGKADFILCLEGLYLALETKPSDKPLEPLQAKRGRDVIKAGGISLRITEADLPTLYVRLATVADEYLRYIHKQTKETAKNV